MPKAAAIDKFKGDYWFLSNFSISPLAMPYQGHKFLCKTAEHAYQLSKAKYFPDAMRINQLDTPGKAKRMGRLIEIREDWEEVKLDIMYDVIWIKFQDVVLANWLINTKDAELIEGNTWGDTFWGVSGGKGENHLGKILMKVRTELIKHFLEKGKTE